MALPIGLARYGAREIILSFLLCGAAGAAAWVWISPWAALLPGALLLFTLFFFRDPRRSPPPGEHVIVSPADGKVVDIEQVDEPEYLGGKADRVGIFLSIFSVHVNRAPLAGRIGVVKYKPGKFLAAFNDRASRENESNFIGIETDLDAPAGGKLKLAVKQISGVIARRIVCARGEGELLARGEKFGMIKFGSRTELYLPPGTAELAVRVGDKVRAGKTVIGTVVRTDGGAGASSGTTGASLSKNAKEDRP